MKIPRSLDLSPHAVAPPIVGHGRESPVTDDHGRLEAAPNRWHGLRGYSQCLLQQPEAGNVAIRISQVLDAFFFLFHFSYNCQGASRQARGWAPSWR